jgi:hypothetical protein
VIVETKTEWLLYIDGVLVTAQPKETRQAAGGRRQAAGGRRQGM